jgi:MFS family permease
LTAPAAAPASAFGYRAFTMFWLGRIASIFGFQMLMVAIGWQLYTMTGSAFDLGMLGIAQFVPMIVLTLLVGHVADRYDNRAILFICQMSAACAAALLALGTAMGWLSPLTIYAIMVLIGAARAFEIPTMVSIIPALVPRELVPAGTAWFVSANQLGQVVGPVVGGLIYGFAGPTMVYGVAIALWCAGASAIFLIHMDKVTRSSEPLSLRSLMGGFRFVWRDRVVLGTISLDMCAVFLAAATGLFPIFARDILQTGPWGLGLLRAAPGLGAFLTSTFIARHPITLPVGPVLFAVVMSFGAATIVFALSTNLFLSLAALMVLGASDAVSVVIRFSLVQLRTPAEMRGRVSAVNSMFTGTSNYLGDFRAGVVASALGASSAVLIGGVGLFAVVAVWMFLFPQLRRIRTYEDVPAAQALSPDSQQRK